MLKKDGLNFALNFSAAPIPPNHEAQKRFSAQKLKKQKQLGLKTGKHFAGRVNQLNGGACICYTTRRSMDRQRDKSRHLAQGAYFF